MHGALSAETRTVTADQSLRASTVYKWFLGADYRDVWATPIEVEVLDLQPEAGGLRPLFRDGPGVHIRIEGPMIPEVWDVESTFGAIRGDIAGFIGLTQRLLLAVRVGGKNVFGTYPFQEAAYLGGADSVRGLATNRFAGDAGVFAKAELRFTLGRASALAFRGEWGIFVFGDVGRVFVDGDDSDKWHPSGGGGISLATLERSLLWSMSIARSEEQSAFFFNADFSY